MSAGLDRLTDPTLGLFRRCKGLGAVDRGASSAVSRQRVVGQAHPDLSATCRRGGTRTGDAPRILPEPARRAEGSFEPGFTLSLHRSGGATMRRLRAMPRLGRDDVLLAAPFALVVIAIAGLVVDRLL